MKKNDHSSLIIALLSAGVLGGIFLSHAATETLFRIALFREGGKRLVKLPLMRRIVSGVAPKNDFLSALKESGKALQKVPTQEIRYKAKDGLLLIGHWYPCENPRRIIIAMHGWRSNWARDFGLIAPFWHQNGCSILFAEQRGQGKSGGDRMGFGVMERHDCLAWCEWVNNRIGRHLPIYLAGISMGAATVLMAAGLGLPKNVHGIIADCGFTSPHEIWRHVAEHNLHLRYRLRGYHADYLCKKNLKFSTNTFSTIDAMHQNTIPTLLIHGAKDHFVPPEMTVQNFDACSAPKRILIIPEADHGMSYYLDPEGYQRMLLCFFGDFDQ